MSVSKVELTKKPISQNTTPLPNMTEILPPKFPESLPQEVEDSLKQATAGLDFKGNNLKNLLVQMIVREDYVFYQTWKKRQLWNHEYSMPSQKSSFYKKATVTIEKSGIPQQCYYACKLLWQITYSDCCHLPVSLKAPGKSQLVEWKCTVILSEF